MQIVSLREGQTRAGPSQGDPQQNGDPEPMETLGTGDWCRPESMRSPGTGKAQGAVAALGRKRRLVQWAVWEANEKQMRAAERGQS
jgi:hypothetical protein